MMYVDDDMVMMIDYRLMMYVDDDMVMMID